MSARPDQSATTTDEFPVRRFARWIYWAVYAQTPAGRRERRILSRPDVQQGLREALAEAETWRAALDQERADG